MILFLFALGERSDTNDHDNARKISRKTKKSRNSAFYGKKRSAEKVRTVSSSADGDASEIMYPKKATKDSSSRSSLM